MPEGLAASLPRQGHVWITSDNFVRFHKNEFEEIFCKLDSAEYALSI